MKKVLVTFLVPCLNERETIKEVVRDIKINARSLMNKNYEIIVADNGSTDGTLEILRKEKGIRVINVPIRGYGAALHWGIMNAKGKYILFADADLSYPFSNARKFTEVIKESPDFVSGSRFAGTMQVGAMKSVHKYLGTPTLTFLINILYGTKSTDCNCGMRMVKKSFYRKLNIKCSGMEYASELLLKSALYKGKFIEVPIRFLKDKRGKAPHLSTWADGWRQLKTIILLKPQSMYILLFVFLFLSIVFYQVKFAMAFLFAELFIVLSLSLLALDLIASAINHKPTKVSRFLTEFKLVPITFLISIFVGIFILAIPETRLGTKLFFVSILGLLFMWIFFIETIKTHLINKLPDDR